MSNAMLLLLFAAAAASAGHALARKWRPAWQLLPYAMLLAAGARFLDFALFGGVLLSAGPFALAALILLAAAGASYRATQAGRMAAQYPWLYERAGIFHWRDRG
jgi:hypothetical protein